VDPGAAMTATTNRRTARILHLGAWIARVATANVAVVVYALCAGGAVAAWYSGADLVWGDDATHPLSLATIDRYLHLSDNELGAPDGRKFPFLLPWGGLLALWHALGLPFALRDVQPILVVALVTTSASGAYALVRVLLPGVGRLGAFAGGLFYAFNIYSMTTVWSSMAYLGLHYAFLPLVVLMWVKALRRATVLGVLTAALAWLLALTPAYITTPIAVTDSVLFAGVSVAAVVWERGRRLRTLAAAAGIYATWLAGSVFWIVPLVVSSGAELSRGLSAGDALSLFGANSAPLLDAVRLGGYWAVTSDFLGHPYFPWSDYYTSVGLRSATVLPIVAALGVFGSLGPRRLGGRVLDLDRDERRVLLLMLAIALIALFLITGTHAPLGDAKAAVVERLHLSGPFRSVYQRFGGYLVLAYTPLVAAGIATMAKGAGLIRREVAVAVAIVVAGALAVVPSLPMWNGRIMDKSGFSPARRVTVPADYGRLDALFARVGDESNVLVIPYGGPTGTTTLTWDQGQRGYHGVEPLRLLSARGILTADATAPYLRRWVDWLVGGERGVLGSMLLLNTRFVVFHLDQNANYLVASGEWAGLRPRDVVRRLEANHPLKTVLAADDLRVLSWPGWKPFRIFAARIRPHGAVTPFNVRAIPYRREGAGHYVVDAGALKRGETLVVNRPFDARWRAEDLRPYKVAPGLTAFSPPHAGRVDIVFGPERTVALALWSCPVVVGTVGIAALVLAGRARRRRASDAS
jgi:hypothetical protein